MNTENLTVGVAYQGGETDWMIRRHYLGRWPGVVVLTLALRRDSRAVGVIVFALPPPETAVRYGGVVWELARLWVDDAEPRNTESWFIARAIRHIRAAHPEVMALVSYADPSAGHTGTIYKATNWTADGRTDGGRKTPRSDYIVTRDDVLFSEMAEKKYSRRAHIPYGASFSTAPRVSKWRYVYRLDQRRGPSRTA